jgi:hypothetical protein
MKAKEILKGKTELIKVYNLFCDSLNNTDHVIDSLKLGIGKGKKGQEVLIIELDTVLGFTINEANEIFDFLVKSHGDKLHLSYNIRVHNTFFDVVLEKSENVIFTSGLKLEKIFVKK